MIELASIHQAPLRRFTNAAVVPLMLIVLAGMYRAPEPGRAFRDQSGPHQSSDKECTWYAIGQLPSALYFSAAAIVRSDDHETIYVHGGLLQSPTTREISPSNDLFRFDLPSADKSLADESISGQRIAPAGEPVPARWGHIASVVEDAPDNKERILLIGGADLPQPTPTSMPSPTASPTPQPTRTSNSLSGTGEQLAQIVAGGTANLSRAPVSVDSPANAEAKGDVFEFVPEDMGSGMIRQAFADSALALIHASSAVVHDETTGNDAVLVFGGRNSIAQSPQQQVFAYVADRTTPELIRLPSSGNPPLYGHGMIQSNDPTVLYLFGGSRQIGSSQSTLYRVDVADDFRVGVSVRTANASGLRPPARLFHSMMHDRARDWTVLFSGLTEEGSTQLRADAWLLDHSEGRLEWRRIGRPSGTSALYGTTMVYSQDHEAVIMFGGLDTNGDPRNVVYACFVPPPPTPIPTTVTPIPSKAPSATRTPDPSPTFTQVPSATPTVESVTPTTSPVASETPSKPKPLALLPYIAEVNKPDPIAEDCAASEAEPNNGSKDANETPNLLRENTWTCGWLTAAGDHRDMYRFEVDRTHDIAVWLRDIPVGHRYDLSLYILEEGQTSVRPPRTSDPTPPSPGVPTPATPDPWRGVKNVTTNARPGSVYYVMVELVATKQEAVLIPELPYLLRWSEAQTSTPLIPPLGAFGERPQMEAR